MSATETAEFIDRHKNSFLAILSNKELCYRSIETEHQMDEYTMFYIKYAIGKKSRMVYATASNNYSSKRSRNAIIEKTY